MNAISVEGVPYSFMIMVRGREVSFSIDTINAYLGNPTTLEEGALCKYGKRLDKGNWNVELVKDALVMTGKSYEVNAYGVPKNFLRKKLKAAA